MKLAKLGLVSILPIYAKLSSTCENDNLILDIPYPDKRTAKLLFLDAGTCDQDNYGGSLVYDENTSMAKVTIPISSCGLKDELYGEPVSTRLGLYRPTANVTFGENIKGANLIFRNMHIAAECGTKTTYQVEFNYDAISSVDKDGCQEHDGVCVFPAYGDEIEFAIKEYTDESFTEEINDENGNQDQRAKLAGQTIYLSIRAANISDGHKFSVSNCEVVSGEKRFPLFNAATDTDPTCELPGIGFSASYEEGHFNFQHILFLLDGHDHNGVSSFNLECTVEVCDKTDGNSKCNQQILPCMKNDAEIANYMCDGRNCASGKNCQVQQSEAICIENVCLCDNGEGAIGVNCLENGSSKCSSCNTGFDLVDDVCEEKDDVKEPDWVYSTVYGFEHSIRGPNWICAGNRDADCPHIFNWDENEQAWLMKTEGRGGWQNVGWENISGHYFISFDVKFNKVSLDRSSGLQRGMKINEDHFDAWLREANTHIGEYRSYTLEGVSAGGWMLVIFDGAPFDAHFKNFRLFLE